MIIRELTQGECDEELKNASLGRVACAHEGQPYVVPVHIVVQETHVYSFSLPGQKITWMRANPRVCLLVDSVKAVDEWTSIVALGRFLELQDTPDWADERRHAYELLKTRAAWWEPGAVAHLGGDSSHPQEPIFYRIDVDHVTGHRASPKER